ncbi:MAG TPA: NAD(P)-binding protein, partial [Bacteroidia bacterium]|nr:NAD(P)-binding protein [Bacteroidia bacterium]
MKAIVIGSGISGIATAVRLAKLGYVTEVYESNNFVGGKLSEFKIGKFRFDRGPSLFTMPQLVEELYSLCGLNPQIEFPYLKLNESCRYFYDDGTIFRAFHDKHKLIKEVEQVFNVDEHVFLNHLNRSQTMYQYLSTIFMERTLHQTKNYFNKDTLKALANIPKLGLFNKLNDYHHKHLNHSKLEQYFNRFATYNGSNPYKAPATLHIIPHLEHNIGTFFP